MELINQTKLRHFVLEGISDIPNMRAPIFYLVLLLYLAILGGNTTILQLVCLDRQLHTPMYFFLGNLSLMNMSSTTITLHNTLVSFISHDNTVSVRSCFSQFYFFASLAADELLLLAAMGYDRFVAICNPLRYTVIMRHKICALLAILSWVLGFIEFLPYIILLVRLTCYKSNIINHFYCDIVPILKLSCSDSSTLKTLIMTEGMFTILGPCFLTVVSYVFFIVAILRIRTGTGRRKAFYTCSSHLTIVVLLYASLIFQYLKPNSIDTLESNKMFSLFNTAAVPLLNPLIYSLKNKDVKAALRRRLKLTFTNHMEKTS
ncbi:olfactory receptor 6C74-like [Discoglossus pictus]